MSPENQLENPVECQSEEPIEKQISEKIAALPLNGSTRKRYFIFNTGCIRRALDSTRVHNYFQANGWVRTNWIGRADIVVISTCGAVKQTEDLSLTALGAASKKVRKGAKLVVTGCLPKIDAEKIKAIKTLDNYQFIPTRNLHRFDDLIRPEVKFDDMPQVNMVTKEAGLLDYVLAYRLFRHSFFIKLYKRMSTSKAFLKCAVFTSEAVNRIRGWLGMEHRPKIIPYYNIRVAEGCGMKCTYCSIRFATGRVKSKPIPEVLAELKEGLKQGHELIQLVCEDVGSYGLDSGSNIAELLDAMLAVEGKYKLILIDFGGHWLVKHYDRLLPLFEKHPDKIREFYVSLQSGSQKILDAMKRPEQIDEVMVKLKDMRERLPDLILRTTVIIGFPGETEEDFQKTVEVVQQVKFNAVELNKYEDRPGTEASMMKDKISDEVIERRHEEISKYV